MAMVAYLTSLDFNEIGNNLISAWKPLSTVHNHPLAICDPKSVDQRDLFSVDRVSDVFVGEVYYLRFRESQKWYWFSEQEAKETLLFLSFVSQAKNVLLGTMP
jgi:hypothetical protein